MDIEPFLVRWTAREGGAERANYQGFLYELCDALGVSRPEVSGADATLNNYAFERAVRPREADGGGPPKRIDLYKRGCFILEAKQSRLPGHKNALPGATPGQAALPLEDAEPLGRRSVSRGWDVMMLNARRQAEAYVFLLEPDHPAPPFVIVCDVGHCLELYADFSGTGRGYRPYPDRKGYRVYLHDLRDPRIRARLAAVWTDPASLDPTREAARVTRAIAERLAAVSKALEAAHPGEAEAIAHFLMRCIFTLFAEDVDLLPKDRFTPLLEHCVEHPDEFAPLLDDLWSKMDEKDPKKRYSPALRAHVRHFNGNLFHGAKAYRLRKEEIGELLAAARYDWREVDPAIFGTLLEQALDPAERKRLGAHYTPRSYVQRLVEATVMEPLREDWRLALTKAESQKEAGSERKAVETVKAFLRKLCATRVLDPACGTGNFLYVALELMKALEGEVLETLARLGEPESMALDRETVDPHQFLGLELNPRAAAIAELVVWIGYLQQHYRTRTGHPSEPILRAFKNINFGRREGYDAVLTWDGFPKTKLVMRDGGRVETYPNPRRPDWPEAEFIVGNPPFIGNKRMKRRLTATYVSALRSAYPDAPGSVDLVMYWVDRSAKLLTKGLRRFGLVTTNSISQPLNRTPVDRMLASGANQASIVYCVPDHPWVDVKEGAAVRVAMLVAEFGRHVGRLVTIQTAGLRRDNSEVVSYSASVGVIRGSLTIGFDPQDAGPLLANKSVSQQGVIPVGEGFRLTPSERRSLISQEKVSGGLIRPYCIGQDIMDRPIERYIIDVNHLDNNLIRRFHPKIYGILLERVKHERDINNDPTFRRYWWKFGRARPEIAGLTASTQRFIATCRTSRHRVFVFLTSDVVPDAKIIFIGLCDGADLAVLSSRIHLNWATLCGAWLGHGNDSNYNHSQIFDSFPFPRVPAALRRQLSSAGEELDALRKTVQAKHSDLTLTALYNVLEKIKAAGALSAREEDVKRRGLVLILKELHETIDRLALEAYGWPKDLSDEAIIERLVALNAERAREEAAGLVRWLRPDYQIPRFAKETARRSGELALAAREAPSATSALPAFPADRDELPLAIEAALAAAGRPLTPDDVARAFRGGARGRTARVAHALATLARYGHVSSLPGGRYAARRAA